MGIGSRQFLTRHHAEYSFDEHCLVVAGGNLHKALQRLSPETRREFGIQENIGYELKLLRNIYEHWDELRNGYRQGKPTGAAQKLSKEFPNAEPWSILLYPDREVVLANQVSLSGLKQKIRSIEARAVWRLRALRREGSHKAGV